jgi:hypothetical protein
VETFKLQDLPHALAIVVRLCSSSSACSLRQIELPSVDLLALLLDSLACAGFTFSIRANQRSKSLDSNSELFLVGLAPIQNPRGKSRRRRCFLGATVGIYDPTNRNPADAGFSFGSVALSDDILFNLLISQVVPTARMLLLSG